MNAYQLNTLSHIHFLDIYDSEWFYFVGAFLQKGNIIYHI